MSTTKDNKKESSWSFNSGQTEPQEQDAACRRVNEHDFDEKARWRFDEAGVHKQMRDVQPELYGAIMEIVQNAFDSNDTGEANTIEITVPYSTDPTDPILEVRDHGNMGITKDYPDLQDFLNALKATTEKNRRGLHRKGIGMSAYPNVGKIAIITSMNRDFIHRIPIGLDENDQGDAYTCFGKVLTKPTREEYMRQFGIFSPGTLVASFNRPEKSEPVIAGKIRKTVIDKYCLRLYDNPKLKVVINGGKDLKAPVWMYEHPPQIMSVKPEVRGHIWGDETGNGRIMCFQDGFLVTTIQAGPRQCKGYVEINSLETNAARTGFVDNPALYEFTSWLAHEVTKFPNVATPTVDAKSKEQVINLGLAILGPFLHAIPQAPGPRTDNTKIEAFGDKHGTDSVGYQVHPEPDPTRDIKEREFDGRDPDNVTKIGDVGDDKVKKQDDKKKQKRKETRQLEYTESDLGKEIPLFNLQKATGKGLIPLIVVNKQNEEYPIFLGLQGQTRALMISVWMSEIVLNESAQNKAGLPDYLRMRHSRARVTAFRQGGLYPVATSTTSSTATANRDN